MLHPSPSVFKPQAPSRFATTACTLDGIKAFHYSVPARIGELRFSESLMPRGTACDFLFLACRRIEALSGREKRLICDGAIPLEAGVMSLRLLKQCRSSTYLINALAPAHLLRFAETAGVGRPSMRENLTWVDGSSFLTAWLVPPPHAESGDLLHDLATFVRGNLSSRGEPALLAQATLFQFIHIHPLADGNGRFIRLWLAALSVQCADPSGLALCLMMLKDRRQFGRIWSGDEEAAAFLAESLKWTVSLLQSIMDKINQCLELHPDCKAWRSFVISHCCFGYFSKETIRAIESCGDGLAERMYVKASERLACPASTREIHSLRELMVSIGSMKSHQ